MRYDVTYHLGGEDHTTRVEAGDAAGAADAVRQAHEADTEFFELLAVQLIEEEQTSDAAAPSTR